MALTITGIVLFIGLILSWIRLPGSISNSYDEVAPITPELAGQTR